MDSREYFYYRNMDPNEYFVEYGRGQPSKIELFWAWFKYEFFKRRKKCTE